MQFTAVVSFLKVPIKRTAGSQIVESEVRLVVDVSKRENALPKMKRSFSARFVRLRKKQGYQLEEVRWGKVVKMKYPFSELISEQPAA